MEKIAPNLLADDLIRYRDIISFIPRLRASFGGLLHISLVMDAGAALTELDWLIKAGRATGGLTGLQEVIDAGVLTAYAPMELDAQVRKEIPGFAARTGKPAARYYQEWERYKHYLRFCQVTPQTTAALIDIDNLPYQRLFDLLTGMPLARPASSPEVNVSLAGITISGVSVGLVALLAKMIKTVMDAYGRLPATIKVAILATGAMLAVNPGSRQTISRALAHLVNAINSIAVDVRPRLRAGPQQRQQQSNDERRAKVIKLLPPQKRTLKEVAYSICAAAGRPLSVSALEEQVLRHGYRSRARSLRAYLTRTLRGDARFIQRPDGLWSLAPDRAHSQR